MEDGVRARSAVVRDDLAMRADEGRTGVRLIRTVPALPVRDVAKAAAHYCARFGFEARHQDPGFAVVVRDEAVIHLWGATDEEWRSRPDLVRRPICSGAESFLSGTASCRIEVADVVALFEELQHADVLHAVSRDGITTTDLGSREFAAVDLDGNLLTFYCSDPG